MSPRSFPQVGFVTPTGATDIILVRHGASAPLIEGEPFPLTDGHGDPALAPEGHAQAEIVCQRLTRASIDAIVVTSLQRTHQTAAPLATRLGLTPEVEPDLREVFMGDWEGGLFRQKAADGHPAFMEMIETRRWEAIPGAETTDGFSARCVAGLNRVAERHAGRKVAVFVHGGVIGALVGHCIGVSPFAVGGADNASIHNIVIEEGRWLLRSFNDIAHFSGHFDEQGPN